MDFLRHYMEKGLIIMQWSAKLRTEQANCAFTTEMDIKRTLWDNYVPWGALFVLSQQGGNNL